MMTKIVAFIQSYVKSDEGATAIEYGLIAAGISLAIVAAVFAFGDDLERVFDTMGESMSSAADRAEEGQAQ